MFPCLTFLEYALASVIGWLCQTSQIVFLLLFPGSHLYLGSSDGDAGLGINYLHSSLLSRLRSSTQLNEILSEVKFKVTRALVSVCVLLQKRGSTSVTCVLTQPSAGLTSISTWPSTLSSWSTQMLSRSSVPLQLTLPSARTVPTTTGSENRPKHGPLLFWWDVWIQQQQIKSRDIFPSSLSATWFVVISWSISSFNFLPTLLF